MSHLAWQHVLTLIGQVGVLIVLSIGAYLLVRRFRGRADDDCSLLEVRRNVREMHHRGELSEHEYRTIKTVLEDRLRQELNGSGEQG